MSGTQISSDNYSPTRLGGTGQGSFLQRQLAVVFDIYDSNTSTSSTRVTLSDLRVIATIQATGGYSAATAQIRIFGVPSSLANKVTSIGAKQIAVKRNLVTLQAGDPTNGLATIFQGNIVEAYADYSGQPDVAIDIVASSMFYAKINPIPATSGSGLIDVGVLMQNLAAQCGWTLVNHGVQQLIPNPYYPGTATDQIKDIARDANIEANVELNKLHIWNKDIGRTDVNVLVSPQTGLQAYPRMSSKGIMFDMLFNPVVGFGCVVQVQSSLQMACGAWQITELTHNLESENPGGAWFSHIEGVRQGSYPTAPAPAPAATPTTAPTANAAPTPTPTPTTATAPAGGYVPSAAAGTRGGG